MFLLLAIGAIAALCALLWRAAVYALPLFAGLSAGWWSLNHGAGIGCVVVGSIAGALTLAIGRSAVTNPRIWIRRGALVLFVMPAAYTGFGIVADLAGGTRTIWIVLLALIGGLAASGTAYTRLTAPRAEFGHECS